MDEHKEPFSVPIRDGGGEWAARRRTHCARALGTRLQFAVDTNGR